MERAFERAYARFGFAPDQVIKEALAAGFKKVTIKAVYVQGLVHFSDFSAAEQVVRKLGRGDGEAAFWTDKDELILVFNHSSGSRYY